MRGFDNLLTITPKLSITQIIGQYIDNIGFFRIPALFTPAGNDDGQ
jgi:hypothetical protein